MRQVVAYKGLRTMENHFKLSGPKTGRGRLQGGGGGGGVLREASIVRL